ncbi:hypothetical protein [Mycobacterium sp. M23085]|uniref:hypothetical protein n=1 Tax=Mycobacterium sp. M23085 TaxID=3378087 RepID=UPI0038781A82
MSDRTDIDGVAQAVGRVTEALETSERARGHLYSFHQLTGRADLQLDEAVARLQQIGEADLARHISRELIGRNVLAGRWSFQIVEEYDDGYYRCFKETEQLVRTRLTDGQRHLHEMALKDRRRTAGHPAHTASPDDDSAEDESL